MKKVYDDMERIIRRRFLPDLHSMASDLPDPINSEASKIVYLMVESLVSRVYRESYNDDIYYQDLRILCNSLLKILDSNLIGSIGEIVIEEDK